MSLRWGIWGNGETAPPFCEALKRTEGVELAAVFCEDGGFWKALIEKGSPTQVCACINELVTCPEVDVIYVATPHSRHMEHILLCLEHRKHVVCEPPLALTEENAKIVFQKAEACECFVMEGMHTRFQPSVQKAREWVADRLIGPVCMGTCIVGVCAQKEHPVFAQKEGGGALYALTGCPIETFSYVINQPIREVHSSLRFGNTAVDESGIIILHYDSSDVTLQCTVHAQVYAPCAFYGAKGYLLLHRRNDFYTCERYNEQGERMERVESSKVNGFACEIAEVRDSIAAGLLQNDQMPWAATLQCLRVWDQCFAEYRGNAW